MHGALRHADQMTGLIDRHGDFQRVRIGKAHVLAGKAGQSSRDIERILPCLQHPRQPVDCRVRVGIAHGFVQRGDQIIMLLAVFIIKKGFLGRTLLQRLPRHGHGAVRGHFAVEHDHLQRGQRRARVTVGKHRNQVQKIWILQPNLLSAKTARVGQRTPEQSFQIVRRECLQHKHLAARQQRPVDFKRGILRCRADQDDAAFFDKRQERILLRLIKPVDFIDEHDGLFPVAAVIIRLLHDCADFLDAAGDGGKINKGGLGSVGDDARQRRLAHARRPPEDHRRNLVALDQPPQYLPLSQQMTLPHIFFQRLRAQPRRQGLRHTAVKERRLAHFYSPHGQYSAFSRPPQCNQKREISVLTLPSASAHPVRPSPGKLRRRAPSPLRFRLHK